MVAEWFDPRKERATGPGRGPERGRDRRELTELIDAVDAVLDALQHLHLADLHRVPTAYTTQLEHLTARLPAEVRSDLRTGIPIATLMESLYSIQGKLMTRRSGRTGEAMRDDAAPRSSAGGYPWSTLR